MCSSMCGKQIKRNGKRYLKLRCWHNLNYRLSRNNYSLSVFNTGGDPTMQDVLVMITDVEEGTNAHIFCLVLTVKPA